MSDSKRMRGPRQRPSAIASVVSRTLRIGSVSASAAYLVVIAIPSHAAESNTLTAQIPSQSLALALDAFRRQTGLQLIYLSSVVGRQKSQPVPAGLAHDEALALLLEGTGLRFEHLSPRSIRIFPGAATARETTSSAVATEIRDDVIITADRGAEIQDLPGTIQALNGDQLTQLNVTSTYDLLKYTANVTISGDGPGTGTIFMRGLGGSGQGIQSQATVAPFPNVALYLDDQSMQFPAHNNDVYLVDMERVEILEGPQGTLSGGGAQAGIIRYVTNKPRLEATSGEANASYGVTAGGDPNTALSAVLNVPLVASKFALRAVMFSERRGGYIDNVAATIDYRPGTIPHDLGGNPSANNGALQGNNTNSIQTSGVRVSALWRIIDHWDALLQQNYQQMSSDGYFDSYPISTDGRALQKYQVTTFQPAFNKDRYQSTALAINGKMGSKLDFVYRGSYMTRQIESQQDYSNYLRGNVASSYYACIGTGAGYFNQFNFPQLAGKSLQCGPAVGNWNDKASNQHQSHEIRVSTDAGPRVRGLVGAFWEKFVIDDNMNFNYLRIPQCSQANVDIALAGGADCLAAVGPFLGAFATTPGLRTGTNTAFGEDVQRGYKQTALFTSIDFDLIPNVLTLTGGLRWYKYDEFEYGSEYSSQDTITLPGQTDGLQVDHLNGACTAAGGCGFPINLKKSESGHRWRGSLAWHLDPDTMAYYTYSEGSNPGGFNRVISTLGQPPTLLGVAQYSSTDAQTQQYGRPAGYDADSLINNEVGLKSEFLDHRVLLNLSTYYMEWKHVQQILYDPAHLTTTSFNVNGSSYVIKGFEVQFLARITDALSVQGSSSVNSASQSNTPCLLSVGVDPNTRRTQNNPTPKGTCITQIGDAPYTNPFGQLGARPAFAPPWMFNVRARYDWASGAYRPFGWVGASHIAAMNSQPANFPDGTAASETPPAGFPDSTLLRFKIPGYTSYDAGIGVGKDSWTAQIQCHNLTNAYGPINISTNQFIKAEVPLRPRVISFLIEHAF
jgi:iron complex outermembrane recepter protein